MGAPPEPFVAPPRPPAPLPPRALAPPEAPPGCPAAPVEPPLPTTPPEPPIIEPPEPDDMTPPEPCAPPEDGGTAPLPPELAPPEPLAVVPPPPCGAALPPEPAPEDEPSPWQAASSGRTSPNANRPRRAAKNRPFIGSDDNPVQTEKRQGRQGAGSAREPELLVSGACSRFLLAFLASRRPGALPSDGPHESRRCLFLEPEGRVVTLPPGVPGVPGALALCLPDGG